MRNDRYDEVVDEMQRMANDVATDGAKLLHRLWAAEIRRLANPTRSRPMSDAESRRLEDRIDAAKREGELRLEVAMAKIDGKFEVIAKGLADIKTSVAGQKSLIIGTAVALAVAVVGSALSIWGVFEATNSSNLAAQANMLSAFQSGIALRSVVPTAQPPQISHPDNGSRQ